MNIDFKHFKKIEENDKHTILQHPSGHSVKIAHKGLSEKNKKELSELPMYMAKGGYAKFAQRNDPNMKGSKGSGASKTSKPLPDASFTPPKEAKNAYTEPDNSGTRKSASIPGAPGPHEPDDLSAMARNAFYQQHGQYPPCINTSCKSYGRPHPNCRCYGPTSEAGGNYGMAEGGEVEHFCSKTRPHQEGCQYFAEKGLVEPVPDMDPNEQPMPQPTPAETFQQAAQDQAAKGPSPVEQGQAAQEDQGPLDVQKEIDQSEPPISGVADSSGNFIPDQAPQDQDMVNAQFLQQRAKEHSDMLMKQAQAISSDYDQGHITPKTYKSLFSDQSLPGKIGTLFGLMLGGPQGAQNYLHMMDNQIQRDLLAQQESVTNKQNFMSAARNALITDSSTTGNDVNNMANQRALAWSAAARASLHEQVQNVMNLPEGSPERARGMMGLSILSKGINAKEADMFSQAGLAQAQAELAGQQIQGQPGGGKGPQSAVDLNKLNQLERNSKLGIPGAPDENDLQRIGTEASHFDQVRALRNDYDNAFNTLDKQFKLAGRVSPNSRKTILQGLAAKAAPVVGVNHAAGLVESMMPQATDWSKTRDIKKQSNNQYFNVLEAGHPTLQRFGLMKPYQQAAQSQGTAQKPLERADKSGKIWLFDPKTKKNLGPK